MAAANILLLATLAALLALCCSSPAPARDPDARVTLDARSRRSVFCGLGEIEFNGACTTVCALGPEYHHVRNVGCRRLAPHAPCGPGTTEVGGPYGDCAPPCPEPKTWIVGFGCREIY